MYLMINQQVKNLTKEEYKTLRTMCHTAKSLTNQAIYEVRKGYEEEGKYLNYYDVYAKLSKCNNYKLLQAQTSQQCFKQVDRSFKSFFALLKMKPAGTYHEKVKTPKFLPKDGYTNLTIPTVNIKDDKFVVPFSRQFAKTHKRITIKVPSILKDKTVKQILIIPKSNARFFEIQYIYKVDEIQRELNKETALAIDLGINNLCTCVTSNGNSFIMDGKRLKSMNQWYNKRNSKLQSIKDKQGFGRKLTNQQTKLLRKRNNRITDYIHKTSKYIINYCIDNNIGNLVCGMNKDFQRNSNLGKKNNQTFVSIPFGKIQHNLEYLSKLNGINFVTQEESYTSKSSFWDKDKIPIFGKEETQVKFSGRRIKRGLYKTKEGKILNADVNGALNILRKSNVVSLSTLYNRGELGTPIRIRIK